MKKRVIIIISVVVVLLSSIGIYAYRFSNKTKEYYWRNVMIEKGDVTVLVTATGTMAADTSVDVGVQVSGSIANIKADFNDVVKKGQVIATLDTTLYYATKLDALATLQRNQASVEQANKAFNRAKVLFDQKVLSKADYELAFTAFKTAQSDVSSAQAQVNRANINLQYCTIKAPISGTIIARNVQVGNMVIASFNSPVLFTIANNLQKMQVQVNVDEADIGQLKVGQKAKFTVDAYPEDVFTGLVTQIRHQPVIVTNVVNYVVIIEVPNPKLKLIPGLTVNANISIQERNHVLKVASNAFTFVPPLEYIQVAKSLSDSARKVWIKKLQQNSELKKQQIVEHDETVGYLWIIKDKEIFPMQVHKGLNDGSFTEISGGIKEGYLVATGVNKSSTASDTKSSNPFLPKFPSRKK